MSKGLKKIGIIIFIVLTMIIILPFIIPINYYKSTIEHKISEELNRDFKVTGNINLALVPDVAVKLHGVQLASLPSFSHSNLLEIAEVKIALSLIDLFKGNVVIKSITVDKPIVNLEVSKQVKNWELVVADNKPKTINNDSNENLVLPFYVKTLKINDGAISYIDSKEVVQFKKIDLVLHMTSNTGPLDFDLSLNALEQEIKTQGTISKISNILPLELKAHVLNQEINFHGELDVKNLKLIGKIQGHGDIKNTDLHFFNNQDYSFFTELEVDKEQAIIKDISFDCQQIGLKGDIKYNMNSGIAQGNAIINPSNLQIDFSANIQNNPVTAKLKLTCENITALLNKFQIDTKLPKNLTLSTDIFYHKTQDLQFKNILFNMASAEIAGQVVLKNIKQNMGIVYDLKLSNALNLINKLGMQITLPLKNITSNGSIEQNANIYTFISNTNIFESNVGLNGQINLSQNKPKFQLTLKSSFLDLDKIIPQNNNSQNNTRSHNSNIWSDDKIELAFLDMFDGSLNLDITKLKREQLILNSLKGTLLLDAGELKIQPLTASIYGGSLSLSASLKGTKTQQWAVKASLKNANLHSLAPEHNRFKITSGQIDSMADLQSSGNSIKAYINNLKGIINLKGSDGVVTGVNLNKIIDALSNAKNLQTIMNVINSGLEGGSTNFKNLNSALSIQNGDINIDKCTLEADKAVANVSGKINLPDYSMNTTGTLTVQNLPPFSANFYGSISSPAYKADLTELKNYLIKNVLNSVVEDIKNGNTKPKDILRSLIGGQNDSSQSQPEDDTEKVKPSIEGALKNLFK